MKTNEFLKWLKAEFPTDDKHHKQAREALGVTLNGMNKALKGDVVSVRMKKNMIMVKAGMKEEVGALTVERCSKLNRFLSTLATDEAFSVEEAANWLLDYFDLISL